MQGDRREFAIEPAYVDVEAESSATFCPDSF